MNNLHCPAFITALLHFHTTPEPLRDTPINQEATDAFLIDGFIEPDPDIQGRYCTTPLGAAYVSALCMVPPPTPGFTDAMGNTYDEKGMRKP